MGKQVIGKEKVSSTTILEPVRPSFEDTWMPKVKLFAPAVIGGIVGLYLISQSYNFLLSILIGVVIYFCIVHAMKGGVSKTNGLEKKQSRKGRASSNPFVNIGAAKL